MGDSSSSVEHAPLLRHSESSSGSLTSTSKSIRSVSDTERDGKNGELPNISRSRGALIASSVGFLIFLQGEPLLKTLSSFRVFNTGHILKSPLMIPATNISILTTTQSSIAADLDAFEKVTWLTSSYLIAMSSLAPLMGRLSQVFSPRICLFASTIMICVGTIITALSMSFEAFMVGRVVTGSGAAGVLVVASIIVIQMADQKNRGLYLGFVNSGMTVGISLGAIIAGALEPRIGWKPLFGIQAPLSLISGIGILLAIPATYTADNGYSSHSLRQKLARIDYSGCLLLIITITTFLLGLSGPKVLPLPLVLSAFALPVFILNEIYIAKDPVIPIIVLRSRGTLLTCLGTLGFMMARWCILFYAPVYGIAVKTWDPAKAGSILIPTNAGFASGGLLAGYFHIHRKGSFYLHSVIVMALFPITLLVLAFLSTANSSSALYIVFVFFNGLLAGATLNYTTVHLLHLTLPDVHPIGLSLIATFRGFAGSFGSAIGGGLFARVLHKSLVEGYEKAGLKHREQRIRQLLGSPGLVTHLEGTDRLVAIKGYEDALKALFFAGTGLAIIVVFFQASTGWKEPTRQLDEETEGDGVEEEEGLIAGS